MRQDVSQHLERAKELIQVADENLANNHPADSVSRSYYAMFHATTAVLLELGIERSSHKALISVFGESVVKKGLMDKRFHNYLRRAFEARSESDYLPLPSESVEKAGVMLKQATEFVSSCRELIEEKGN